MKTLRAILALAVAGAGSSSALAMPWDVDMYRQQSYLSGELARSPVKGTIPVGHKPWRLTNEEAAQKLTNPIPMSEDSLQVGKRLWSTNCTPCHGATGNAKAPVGPQVGAPDITAAFYAGKAEGSIYGIMMNGGSSMPRYGYKFSEEERWHIVNYVRHLQGKGYGSR